MCSLKLTDNKLFRLSKRSYQFDHCACLFITISAQRGRNSEP